MTHTLPLLLALVACGGTKDSATPATGSGVPTETPTTGTPTGTTSSGTTSDTGTTTPSGTTTTPTCVPPTTPPAFTPPTGGGITADTAGWNVCDYATHIAGYLDPYRAAAPPGCRVWCHPGPGGGLVLMYGDRQTCVSHIPHNTDIFPTPICDP